MAFTTKKETPQAYQIKGVQKRANLEDYWLSYERPRVPLHEEVISGSMQ